MIGISLNSNGVGDDNKKGWIRELVERNSPLCVGIQESKMDSLNIAIVRTLWPCNYGGFASSN